MISDDQPDVPSCPACGRPLEAMNGRCPGCGTRLVLGVQARRAGVFTSFGLVAGVLVGALAMGVVGGATRPAPIVAGTGGTGASEPAGTGSGGRSAPGTAVIPSAATSALGQVAVINGRLSVTLARLRAVLAATPFDAAATALVLRALAADASFGTQIAAQLAKWPAATALSADLATFYGSVRGAARGGLAASLTNDAAYRAAATKMLAVFDGLAAIDRETQRLATEAGISLPGVAPPDASRGPGASTTP